MGAKMIPMVKNKGRTVFGVKMGLGRTGQYAVAGSSDREVDTYCHALRRC